MREGGNIEKALVVGIGNTLRSDDGAGIRAAELVAERIPGITVVTVQEPHPELAEALAHYNTVFFLDASTRVERLTVTPIGASSSGYPEGTHSCSPGMLLALSASLYGHLPEQAFLVEIPVRSLTFGEALTPVTMQMVHECVGVVGRYVHTEQS